MCLSLRLSSKEYSLEAENVDFIIIIIILFLKMLTYLVFKSQNVRGRRLSCNGMSPPSLPQPGSLTSRGPREPWATALGPASLSMNRRGASTSRAVMRANGSLG